MVFKMWVSLLSSICFTLTGEFILPLLPPLTPVQRLAARPLLGACRLLLLLLTSSDVCGGSAVLRHCTKNFFPTSWSSYFMKLSWAYSSSLQESPSVCLMLNMAVPHTLTPSMASNSMKSSRSNMYLHSVFSAVYKKPWSFYCCVDMVTYTSYPSEPLFSCLCIYFVLSVNMYGHGMYLNIFCWELVSSLWENRWFNGIFKG